MLEILNIINIIHSSKEFWKNIWLRSRCIVSLPGLHDAPIFYCWFMKDIPGYVGRYAVTEDGEWNLIREFSSIKCAAKEMHLWPYSISLAYRWKQEKAGGFIWKLINN